MPYMQMERDRIATEARWIEKEAVWFEKEKNKADATCERYKFARSGHFLSGPNLDLTYCTACTA
jgi:hypothetical protein